MSYPEGSTGFAQTTGSPNSSIGISPNSVFKDIKHLLNSIFDEKRNKNDSPCVFDSLLLERHYFETVLSTFKILNFELYFLLSVQLKILKVDKTASKCSRSKETVNNNTRWVIFISIFGRILYILIPSLIHSNELPQSLGHLGSEQRQRGARVVWLIT